MKCEAGFLGRTEQGPGSEGAEMEEGWLSVVLGTCILQNAVNLAESGKQVITSVGMSAKSGRRQSVHEN